MVLKFKIEGMGCEGCVTKILETMKKLEGVEDVEVTLDPPQTILHGDLSALSKETILQKLSELGFSATEI